jgi:signal transduction histidine kinase/ligand-binding sensor domain-containing protein/DNA-binding response OmpR family regulator
MRPTLFTILLLSGFIYAGSYQLQNYSIEDGLVTYQITSIFQDSKGYMWFGSWGCGVSRFDGKTFINFTTEQGLSENRINTIFEDNDGNLWIATQGGGVTKYDGFNFTHLSFKKGINHSVRSMLEDRNGNLWFATFDYGVARYCGDSLCYFTQADGLVDNRVRSILEDRSGNIWIGTLGGGSRLTPIGDESGHSKELKSLQPFAYHVEQFLPRHGVHYIFEDSKDNLWFGTWTSGVFRYDGSDFIQFTTKDGLSHNCVRSITEDEEGNIWFATLGGGVCYYDGKNFNRITVKDGLGDNSVNAVCEDREGNLWFGTNSGVSKYRKQPFSKINIDDSKSNESIRCIFEDSKGRYWFATANGIYVYSGQPEKDSAATLLKKIPLNYAVTRILEDRNQNIWISLWGDGIMVFEGMKCKRITRQDGIRQNEVFSIFEDHNGNIWVGTSNAGVLQYDGKTFTNYTSQNGLNDNSVLFIYEDHYGNMWFGTAAGGLNKFDRRTFAQCTVEDGLPHNTISTIIEDKDGNLWVGMFGGGFAKVNLLDKNKFAVVDTFSTHDGLSSNNVESLVFDNDGDLWIGTDRGICRLDMAEYRKNGNKRFVNYGRDKGVVGLKCVENAACKDSQGTIWFGTVKGVIKYNPEYDRPNTSAPKTYITDIRLDFEHVNWSGYSDSLDSRTYLPRDLRLPYQENHLTFDFVGISLTSPQRVRYQYKLEGIDKAWSPITDETRATYSNLPPGQFTFKLKAGLEEGVWNSTPTTFQFTILAPFWQTWWFRSIGLLFLFATIYGIYRFRIHNIQQQKNRLEALVNERTRSLELKTTELEAQKEILAENKRTIEKQTSHLLELDQLKSKFFANVSHEFRTPLALILGPLEDLISSRKLAPTKNLFRMMYNNARRLLRLINQLLDLSKLDSGKLELNARQGDIVGFIKGIVYSLESLAASKQIRLTFRSKEDELLTRFDPDYMEKIMYNLLSNALKFTGEGGEVAVSISKSPSNGEAVSVPPFERRTGGMLEITIEDTGIGIPARELNYIYDRFYQINDPGNRKFEGTGIGLALTKELVELHHGKIFVESEENKGSKFTIQLPISIEKTETIDSQSFPDLAAINDPTLSAPHSLSSLQDEQFSKRKQRKSAARLVEKSIAPLILIVEDNDDVRAYLHNSLAENHRISQSENGREGVQKAREQIPDLIISDVMMPEMDGYAFCQELKQDQQTSHIPIIMLTAKASEEGKWRGLEIGADDYLIKPFAIKELQIRIKNLIDQRRSLQERFRREILLQPSHKDVISIDETFLQKLRNIIQKNLVNADFSVATLRSELGMSRTQLQRKLRALTGQSPVEIIRSIRLKRARQLLDSHAGNVSEVAYEVGFNNLSYFAKCFKEEFGYLPSEVENHP